MCSHIFHCSNSYSYMYVVYNFVLYLVKIAYYRGRAIAQAVVATFSSRRPRFSPREVRMGLVVG
jgi:hypothetical protein